MALFKEIVTKAVIGKGKRISSNSYELIPENNPDTVLGCWIINHNFSGTNNNGVVYVNGNYDINVWYSYDNDSKTAVSSVRYSYQEKMSVKLKEETILTKTSEIIVRSLKQPTVTNATINNGVIKLDIEKELGVEIVGDTKVKVSVEDSEDDYEIIPDELTDNDIKEVEKKIDEEVKEDYLK